jgi:hypothetical protein
MSSESERWQAMDDLLVAARERPSGERERFLSSRRSESDRIGSSASWDEEVWARCIWRSAPTSSSGRKWP